MPSSLSSHPGQKGREGAGSPLGASLVWSIQHQEPKGCQAGVCLEEREQDGHLLAAASLICSVWCLGYPQMPQGWHVHQQTRDSQELGQACTVAVNQS